MPQKIRDPSSSRRQRQVARDLVVLMRTPRGERVPRISRARRRFRGSLLARCLLDESRRSRDRSPEEAHDLAAAAKAVLYASSLDHEDAPGLWVRALAYLGLALTEIGSDASEAGRERAIRWWQGAASLFQARGLADPALRAELEEIRRRILE